MSTMCLEQSRKTAVNKAYKISVVLTGLIFQRDIDEKQLIKYNIKSGSNKGYETKAEPRNQT